jgi:hypothetical protein
MNAAATITVGRGSRTAQSAAKKLRPVLLRDLLGLLLGRTGPCALFALTLPQGMPQITAQQAPRSKSIQRSHTTQTLLTSAVNPEAHPTNL